MISKIVIILFLFVSGAVHGQQIHSILDMEKNNIEENEKCDNLDFIVLFNDFTGIYFSMGCVWDTEKLYWIEVTDSILFYQPDLSSKIDNIEINNNQELINFIRSDGTNKRIGNIAFGFDFLVSIGNNKFKPISKIENKIDYFYQRNKKIKECNQKYYDKTLKK